MSSAAGRPAMDTGGGGGGQDRVDQRYLPVTKTQSDVFWNIRDIRTNIEKVEPASGARKVTFCLPNTGLLNLESLRLMGNIQLKEGTPTGWDAKSWRELGVRPGMDKFFFSCIDRIVLQTGGTIVEDQRELNLYNHANVNLGYKQPDIRNANNAFYGYNADSYKGTSSHSASVRPQYSLGTSHASTGPLIGVAGNILRTKNTVDTTPPTHNLGALYKVGDVVRVAHSSALAKNGNIRKITAILYNPGPGTEQNGTWQVTIGGVVDLVVGEDYSITHLGSRGLYVEDEETTKSLPFWEHPDHHEIGQMESKEDGVRLISKFEVWKDSILNGRGILPLNIMPRTTLEIYFADPKKFCSNSWAYAHNNTYQDSGRPSTDPLQAYKAERFITYVISKLRLQALYGESPTISRSIGMRGMSMTFASYTNYQYSLAAGQKRLSIQIPVTQRAVDKVLLIFRNQDLIDKSYCTNKLSKYACGSLNPEEKTDPDTGADRNLATTGYTRMDVNRANIRINGIRRYPEDLDSANLYLELRRLYPEAATSGKFSELRKFQAENQILCFSVQTDYSQSLLSGTKTASQTAPLLIDLDDIKFQRETGYYEGDVNLSQLTDISGVNYAHRVDAFVCYTKFLSITKEKIELIE